MKKSIECLIMDFLDRLREINEGNATSAQKLTAAELHQIKPALELMLKQVSNATDVEVIISIDDLDEFDGELAV